MKISILSSNLSSNCLGRAYVLAKMLQQHYEVEIVGPIFGNDIWEPVANDNSIIYKSTKINGRFRLYHHVKELVEKIDGDVIYASKPLFTSFGVGLIKKRLNKVSIVLDIDDWEVGFTKEKLKKLTFFDTIKYIAKSTWHPVVPGSIYNNFIFEKLSFLADDITVAGNFLKKDFGGTILWHARDTDEFNPSKFIGKNLRETYGISPQKKVVLFLGTARKHKGIEDLIRSISLLNNKDVILLLVGLSENGYTSKLKDLAKSLISEKFKILGIQPFDRIPDFLSMSDVFVIPQRHNLATIGQVPAKVFDAMAMAMPIVATDVSDLPEILDGCGWIVESKKPEQLAEVIQRVLDSPEEAGKRGRKARQKCIEKYSWNAMENVLTNIFDKYK